VKRKPIGVHPHAGQYSIVVGFRVAPDPEIDPPDAVRDDLERELRLWGEAYDLADLTVHIRVLGAGGEASKHEIWPPHGPLAHTEDDITTIRTTRDQDTLDTKGRL